MQAVAGAILFAASILDAAAQPTPPTEHVTVTGARSRAVVRGFVQSFAAPTRLIGKISRWEDGVCPLTAGLKPQATQFITSRVREVAALAGAPVNAAVSCRPNIEIVFTTKPQGLLEAIRKEHEDYLGYADNEDQRARLATMTRPIQAWYLTATRDYNGNVQMDRKNVGGGGVQVGNAYFPDAKAYAVSGSRLADGLSSGFYHVIIVIDPGKLADYEIGGVADYIALLSLTQLNALDTCQQLPSIANLLASVCDRRTNALTENDLAYLRGLYKMNSGANLSAQKDEIAYRMKETLEGR